ncbi:MAG: hypothetical protein U0K75_05095 [Christensenellaceae bacterium]|nr:hypothetical protein [Christensenellaceae bacterium]
MMRKALRALAAAVLLITLVVSGCAGSASESVSPEAELLKADGEVLLDGEEFMRSRKAADLQSEIMGVSRKSDEQLFTELAELALLDSLAKKLGVQSDAERSELKSNYDTYMQNAASGMTDAEELNTYLERLQEELGMSDDEFQEWNLDNYEKEINAEQVYLYAAESYTHISDPDYLKESIQHEVQGLAQLMEVECGFPGMENHEFTYDTFIS